MKVKVLITFTDAEAKKIRREGEIIDLSEERFAEIAGRRVLAVKDYKKSIIKYQNNTEEVIYLPKSNVLKFILEGNSSIVVRPSGTEPKMKAYFSVSAETQEKAEALRKQMEEECDDFFMII